MLELALFLALLVAPTGASDEARPRSGAPYVVVALDRDDPTATGFAPTIERVVEFHGARLLECASSELEDLAAPLRDLGPDNVLFVVPPAVLDAALHRRVLALARAVDADPFTDFAFGYLTARDGEALASLWERTVALHEHGLASKRWAGLFVTSGMPSTIFRNHIPGAALRAGFGGESVGLACVESDPEVLAFAARELRRLESASVLTVTGNGDPQGIWLFDGRRNLDRTKHWEYDPARVGSDPEGVMPRLLADDVRALHLASPIVWSGTCHSAIPARAFVENDIVSTFGRTERPTLHVLAADESLALAWLDAGAAALLAPIGANHGMAVDREVEFALSNGASLGEAVKSTYDDLVLAQGPDLYLDVPRDGVAPERREPIMAGGGANRILIGDPALAPFVPTRPAVPLTVTTTATFDGVERVEVLFERDGSFDPDAWDMYGKDRSRDWRIAARVRLPARGVDAGTRLDVTVDAASDAGEPLPYTLGPCAIEWWRGECVLHVTANAPRNAVEGVPTRARFVATFAR
ncbi:MAG: hypothetical protein R3F34_00685 [Planctomycetota bacterium]